MNTDKEKTVKKILIVLGTRPEAVKLAPLIHKIKEKKDVFSLKVCSTGQHKQMLTQALKIFFITPDYNLDIMKDEQDLFDVTNRVLSGLKTVMNMESPDLVVVQGDTTTTLCASLAAYYCKIKVAHIEAGLRTNDKYNPYPEEINRKITSSIADIHFAPTVSASDNLRKEGIEESRIFITSNTVVDALEFIVKRWNNNKTDNVKKVISLLDKVLKTGGEKLVLVTCHRRESFGKEIENICHALREIALNVPETAIVFPVHLNPAVRDPVYNMLGGITNIHLTGPLEYEEFLYLLNKAYLVLTDSGGIQEEAPSLGKPVLIMRRKTERPEGISCGMAKLVGTTSRKISSVTRQILSDRISYDKMVPSKNPYGSGDASEKIIKVLEDLI